MINKDKFLFLALLTLVLFPLAGMAFVRIFTESDIQIMIRQSSPFWQQLLVGSTVGVAMGFVAYWLTESNLIKPSSDKYANLLGDLQLDFSDKVVISICAGFGEELFFRGALQPFIGIWPAAILFVAIHGYLNPKDWRISIYGVTMTLFIGALGYLTESFGIWVAVLAHTFIDLVLLMSMKTNDPRKPIADSLM